MKWSDCAEEKCVSRKQHTDSSISSILVTPWARSPSPVARSKSSSPSLLVPQPEGLPSPLIHGMLALEHTLTKHSDTVLCLLLWDERSLLFTGSQDSRIQVWDLHCFVHIQQLQSHSRSVLSLGICNKEDIDSAVLVSLGRDAKVVLWNMSTWAPISTICQFDGCPLTMLVRGADIFLGGMDTILHHVSIPSVDRHGLYSAREVCFSHHGHCGFIHCIHPSQDPSVFYTGSGDCTLRMWKRISDASFSHHVLEGHDDSVTSICEVRFESPDIYFVVSGCKSGSLRLWKIEFPESITSHCVRTLSLDSEITFLHCSNDWLFTGTRFGSLLVCDKLSLRLIQSLDLKSGSLMSIVSNSKYLVTTGTDCSAKLWRFLRKNRAGRGTSFPHVPACGLSSPFSDSVECFLSSFGLEEYCSVFESQKIDLDSLFLLTNEDLRDLGIPLGPRRRLLFEIEKSMNFEPVMMTLHSGVVDSIVSILREAVSFPSISSDEAFREDCWKCAKYFDGMLSGFGADTKVMQASRDRNPHVFAKFPFGSRTSDRRCRIVVYGHYDVQPAPGLNWRTPPFQLSPLNGYLYGRGATDNKGPLIAMILAAKDLADSQETSNVCGELVFLIDGEEESGGNEKEFSSALEKFPDWVTNADAVIISNTYWIGKKNPCLVYGMRGVLHFTVKVIGPKRNLHSGMHGGSIFEPMNDLVQILAMLQDSEGNVKIPEFYDSVQPVSKIERELLKCLEESIGAEAENKRYKIDMGVDVLRGKTFMDVLMNRWRYPFMSIHGFESSFPGPVTTAAPICRESTVNISIRIVPNQSAEQIAKSFESYVQKCFASLSSPNVLKVELIEAADWWLADPDTPLYQAADEAIRSVWGKKPLYTRYGGTMSTTGFLEHVTGAPVLHLPMGQVSDQAHMENERYLRSFSAGT